MTVWELMNRSTFLLHNSYWLKLPPDCFSTLKQKIKCYHICGFLHVTTYVITSDLLDIKC